MLGVRPLKLMPFVWSPVRIISRATGRSPLFARFQSTVNGQGAAKKVSIKSLMKEYGYSALGIYLGLSFIDLPICYIMVHSLGKEEIEYYENEVKQYFGYGVSGEELKKQQEINRIQDKIDNPDSDKPIDKNQSWFSYIKSQFSWTEFALAYGIHKSLIIFRLPITAAITPGIVKALRRWGFKIGTNKLSTSASLAKDKMVIAKDKVIDATASNPMFGSKPGKKKWWWFF